MPSRKVSTLSASLWRLLPLSALLGALLLCIVGILEWSVLFIKLRAVWSPTLPAMILRNLLLYAAAGSILGAVVGAGLAVVALCLRRRPASFARPGVVWAVLLSAVVLLYWIYAGNVIYQGGARSAVALGIDVIAVGCAALLAALLGRRAFLGQGAGQAAAITSLVLLLLWAPFYFVAAAPGAELIEGGPDLGRVRVGTAVQPAAGSPNVLMIVLDTTRCDCLGCYGGGDRYTPNIDRLAGESVLFEQAITPEPLTRPAISTVLTGVLPRTHGVDTNAKTLGVEFYTLAEALRDHGYVTGAVTASVVLDRFYGTDQGFDAYIQPSEARWEFSRLVAARRFYEAVNHRARRDVEVPANEITRRAAAWIARNHERPFFAFVHYYDPHFPYDPLPAYDLAAREGLSDIPVPYSTPEERFRDDFEMPGDYLRMQWLKYRGEILWMDEHVGRLLGAIDDMGLRDNTLVVLLSDHGEGFENHFYFAHGNRLFDTLVHSVLMFRYPGHLEPSAVDEQVRLADVYPSILTLLGLPLEADIRGESLFGRGGKVTVTSRPAFLVTDPSNEVPFFARISTGVRLPPWKYIETPSEGSVELYDLEADPDELTNLAAARPEVRNRFDRLLDEWMQTNAPKKVEQKKLGRRREEALRALGYVR
jgi:arylsulfatase A-like enzyme